MFELASLVEVTTRLHSFLFTHPVKANLGKKKERMLIWGNEKRHSNTAGYMVALALVACLAPGIVPAAHAQQESASHSVELGIIVTATAAGAQEVIKEFKAGTDFGVLAK